MGKSREGVKRSGAGINKTWLVIGLAVAAFVVGFGALVYFDSRQRGDQEPPAGVEEFDVASGINNHAQETVDYEQNPPAGGPHNNVWQTQGFYEEQVPNERAVHTLEHGSVWLTYSPDLPQDQIGELRNMVEGQDCLLASPYPGLPADTPVVASAWGAQVGLEGADDPNLERFISAYRKGPQTPEPGATCSGGTRETA